VNRDELLKAVAHGGACNASTLGGELTAEQVRELLAVAPSDENSRKVLTEADFSGITFVGSVSFRNVLFAGDASFAGTSFKGGADLALLETRHLSFRGATFGSGLYADGWKAEAINFEQSTFEGHASFNNIDAESLSFSGSRFKNGAAFSDVHISTFLNFVGVSFSERVRDFVAGCRSLHLQRSRLDRGGVFYLHGGEVDLSAVELGASTMIAGSRKSGQFRNQDRSLVVDGGDWRPRLVELEGTNLEQLVLQDVSLARCLFNRSIHLEKLRLEGSCLFDEPPKGLHMGPDAPFLWFWTPRLSIFEERIWRSHTRKACGWNLPRKGSQPGQPIIVSARGDPFAGIAPGQDERQAQAEQLAKTYRALRKGREDARNEPGAGDFYYGEMEMRRAGTARTGERFALWLYWLVSGYGLRPLRTLLALLILVGLSSFLLVQYGIVEPSTYSQAFLASLAAAVNLEYLKPEAFTLTGQWVRIVLKIVGPTLFGVLLLAFWGRVKR